VVRDNPDSAGIEKMVRVAGVPDDRWEDGTLVESGRGGGKARDKARTSQDIPLDDMDGKAE